MCPIRWGDMDAQGHVNNTVYFRYMEQARIEWLERFGWLAGQRSHVTMIVNAACTFPVPLTYPGTIETRLFAGTTRAVERRNLVRITRGRGRYCFVPKVSAKLVWVDAVSGKSCPLPDDLRAALV